MMETQDKIHKLELLLARNPTDETGWFLLGSLYMDAEEYEHGAEAFDRAIELKPDYSAAYRKAGDCHRKMGNSDAARAVYEKGIDVATERGDLQTAKEIQALLRKL